MHSEVIDDQTTALSSDPLKRYYSNLENLQEISPDEFKKFADSGIFLADNIIQIKASLDLFSLHSSADLQRIKERYRYLAKQSHPDSGNKEETFMKIQEAYKILLNWKEKTP